MTMQNDRNDMLNLDKLPIETLLDLFSYLGPEDVSNVAKVSKFFKNIADHNLYNLFWKKKFERHFPHLFSTISIQNNVNWYTQFRTAYHEEYDYDKKKLPLNKRKLFSLVKEGDVLSLQAILKLSDLDLVDKNGISLLEWAKKNQDKQRLLNCFYEIAVNNYKDNSGLTVDHKKTDSNKRTILHWAILCHQPASTVELLILQGADINVVAAGGNALRLAAEEGQAEIVELLITQYHADINARSAKGATALLLAIENGHKNVVDVLLKHNADINIPLQTDGDYHKKFNVVAGDTPLHVASRLGSVAIVRGLLKKGANIETINSHQQTPIDVAVKDARYTNELKLLDLSAKVNRLTSNNRKTFSLFGHKFNYGCSAGQIKNATNALKGVIFEGANESCLNAHKDALNSDEIKPIYRSLRIR